MPSFFLVDVTKIFRPAQNFPDIARLANVLIPNLFRLAGVIFFIMIILAGLSLLKSGGNPEEIKKAQKLLTYSVAGFVIILASYFLVKLVCALFDMTCFGI